MLTLDKRGAEEDECIGWAGDVPRAFPAPRLGVLVGECLFLGREDVGGGGLEGRWGIVGEGGGGNVGGELDCLQRRLDGRGPFQIEM